MTIVITERKFPIDPTSLLPAVNADNQRYWDGLAKGELNVQACSGCGRNRYPIVPVCPYCTGTEWSWTTLSGKAKVYSWVRYQRGYLPEFEDLMPYIVVLAEMEEGVRMFGRLTDKLGPTAPLKMGAALETVIEKWPDGRCVPAFKLAGAK
jgi:uncharacterized OB-fold protein